VAAVLDIIIPLLAGLSILAAVIFALRALRFRSRSSVASYGVAQQEARQAMRIELARGVAAVFVGLILFGVVGLSPRPPDDVQSTEVAPTASLPVTATPTDTVSPASDSATPALIATEASLPTAEPTSTSPVATDTPLPTATNTQTPEPATATVNSEAGVWLRSAPGTDSEQLEWVLEGEVVILLDGLETAEDLEWQRVRTAAGNEGWVAVPFIDYNQ